MERVALVKIKMVDVCTLEDDVYERITGGFFDLDRFDLVRAGSGASEEEVVELVRDAEVILGSANLTRRNLDSYNLELDVLGKYVHRLLQGAPGSRSSRDPQGISTDFLKQHGFQ